MSFPFTELPNRVSRSRRRRYSSFGQTTQTTELRVCLRCPVIINCRYPSKYASAGRCGGLEAQG
ncbi:hypothetical protein F2P79_017923 [Pimephales promelas]|nr:hypothetical protein F2P79_017923 [Pimephales promelas]